MADPQYLAIAWRTLWVSFLSTAFCLLPAVPTAYAVARAPERRRNLLLMLVIVPFWTSFLIRVFAWKSILHPEGLIKKALVFCGLVDPSSQLLYNLGAVILVTVYVSSLRHPPDLRGRREIRLPAPRGRPRLGSPAFQAFRKVFLPGIRQALVTAVLVVFIPSLGSYIVPDIVGGPGSEMLGNKIAQRVFVDRNLPLAGGLSIVLILAVLAPLLGVLALQGKKARIQPPEGGGKP